MITIAFYFESETYRWMAEVMVASARKAMPASRIAQLSPWPVPTVAGVDEVIYASEGEVTDPIRQRSFLGRYFALTTEVRGNMILTNCDIVFLGSVEHVFDDPTLWSLAVPHIASPDVWFDGGAIFARDTGYTAQFWQDVLNDPACHAPDKHVNQQLAAFNKPMRRLYKQKILRRLWGHIYSYVPRDEFDPATGALIVHARGPRKKWMCHYAGLSPALASSYLEGREAIGLPVKKG